MAKILSGRGYEYGQNTLSTEMRRCGWLMYDVDDLVPQQTEVNAGRMLYETYVAQDIYGREMECGRVLITMKGLRYYYKKITGCDYDKDVNYTVEPDDFERIITIVLPEGKYNYLSMVASTEGKTLENFIMGKVGV